MIDTLMMVPEKELEKSFVSAIHFNDIVACEKGSPGGLYRRGKGGRACKHPLEQTIPDTRIWYQALSYKKSKIIASNRNICSKTGALGSAQWWHKVENISLTKHNSVPI